MKLREELFSNRDDEYAKFTSKLIPNISESRIIGVRIPALRQIAKRLAAENDMDFDAYYHEEIMLKGMAIGYSRLSIDEYMSKLDDFVALIDNWCVCDSVCSTLKFTKKHQASMLDYILKYKNSSEYEVRFMIVMLMDYYMDDEYIDTSLEIICSLNREEYYIDMAIAWFVASALAKQYDKAIKLIENKQLSLWVHNKSIQKALESYRVTNENKVYLKTLKIKQ